MGPSSLTVSVFTTQEAKRQIITHVLTEVRLNGTIPEFASINIKQQVEATLDAVGELSVYGVDDGKGNVAICSFTPLLLDPHCHGLGINVSYFIASSTNPAVASHLMKLVVRTAKGLNANWIATSKRVGVNQYTSRIHYL